MAAAWACLALGLATLGLWGRSYWVGDRLARKTAGPVGDAWRSRQIILESRLGRLACSVHTETVWPPAPPGPPSASWRWITEGNPRRPTYLADRSWLYRQMGFSATTLRSEGGSPFGPPRAYRGLFLAAPYWSVALLLSIPPALGWWRRPARQRRRRAAAGLCPRCGYDLRASPGRCPECGAQRDEP